MGLQINNAAGNVRLSNGDYVHRLMGVGSVTVTTPNQSSVVSWPGMAATDEWFIVVCGPAVAVPETNQFRIYTYEWNYGSVPNAWYSVYRR